MTVSQGVRLTANLDKISFEGVKVENDLVIVGFDVSGLVSCDLNVQ